MDKIRKGNHVKIMNGPATVIGEQPSNMSLREQFLGKAEGSIDPRVRIPSNL
jgi:hypothetical protein